jgi:peptidoglycan hydrolase-like protein with peptidoglycan-binding domain
METLAYLHLSLADEAPTDTADVFTLESLKLFEWFKQPKLAAHARIYFLSLVVILSILGMAGGALAQALRQGDRNPEVTLVQERLRELRYFYEFPDGIFGPATRDAVIRFQQDNGLVPDGIVGQETQAALFGQGRPFRPQRFDVLPLPTTEPPPSYTELDLAREIPSALTRIQLLQRGDRDPDVRRLQQELRRRGFNPGPIDGIYGLETERAVREFQREQGLSVDGVAGSETLTALELIPGVNPSNYVVVIPGDRNTLNRVNRVLQDQLLRENISRASLGKSRRGSYVNAGQFSDRNSAESLSYRLRAEGFDARVVYFR